MKKQISFLAFCVLIVTAVAFTTATPQQGKDKNKKEHQQNQPKNQDKGLKPGKGNQDKKDHPDNRGNDAVIGNNGKNDDVRHGNHDKNDSYKWDRASFKDRNKIKNSEKVTLCHKFNRDNEPAVTIRVSSNALKAHMNHGDAMGSCPEVTDKRYSNIFLRNRADYYNTVEDHYDQVFYSRSILDYAVDRLTNSRQQLVVLQNNNMPVADIQRKQATVVELEQNVSLLETLIGIAANLVVNKLL